MKTLAALLIAFSFQIIAPTQAEASPFVRTESYRCRDIKKADAAVYGPMQLTIARDLNTGNVVSANLTTRGKTENLSANLVLFSEEEEENEFSLRIRLPKFQNRVIYCAMAWAQG